MRQPEELTQKEIAAVTDSVESLKFFMLLELLNRYLTFEPPEEVGWAEWICRAERLQNMAYDRVIESLPGAREAARKVKDGPIRPAPGPSFWPP